MKCANETVTIELKNGMLSVLMPRASQEMFSPYFDHGPQM